MRFDEAAQALAHATGCFILSSLLIISLNISPKIDLGRRLICDRQVSLNFQAAYVDQTMI